MKPIAIGSSAANPPYIVHALLISKLLEYNRFSKVIWIISGDRKDKHYCVTLGWNVRLLITRWD